MDKHARQKFTLAPKIALLCLSVVLSSIGNLQAQSATEVEIIAQIEKLKQPNLQERLEATRILRKIGGSAVPALTAALQDEEEQIRGGAAFALGAMGIEALAAVPLLIETLSDPDDRVRLDAAVALRRIGTPAALALVEALENEDAIVRRGASFALAGIGAEAKTTVPVLIEALKDKDEQVRLNAAVALRGIGSPAVPALRQALQDTDGNVRRGAAFALARTASEEQVASSPNPCQPRPHPSASVPNLCQLLLPSNSRPSICDLVPKPSNVLPTPENSRPNICQSRPNPCGNVQKLLDISKHQGL